MGKFIVFVKLRGFTGENIVILKLASKDYSVA